MPKQKTTKKKPVLKIKLITGKTNIQTAINAIQSRGKSFEKLVHGTAVSILGHIEKHNEVSLFNALVDAVPSIVRKNALREWGETFGSMKYDVESKLMVYNKVGKNCILEGTENPFWAFAPEKDYVPYDLLVAVTNIVNIADKRLENANKQDKIPADTLKKLRALVS